MSVKNCQVLRFLSFYGIYLIRWFNLPSQTSASESSTLQRCLYSPIITQKRKYLSSGSLRDGFQIADTFKSFEPSLLQRTKDLIYSSFGLYNPNRQRFTSSYLPLQSVLVAKAVNSYAQYDDVIRTCALPWHHLVSERVTES